LNTNWKPLDIVVISLDLAFKMDAIRTLNSNWLVCYVFLVEEELSYGFKIDYCLVEQPVHFHLLYGLDVSCLEENLDLCHCYCLGFKLKV
jgi:hypothetical protein